MMCKVTAVADVELGLIEIADSPVIAEIRSTERYVGEALHRPRRCISRELLYQAGIYRDGQEVRVTQLQFDHVGRAWLEGSVNLTV